MPASEPTVQTTPRLHRPPVRASILVRSDVNHTFDVFVRTIGTWWPAQTFSAGKARVHDITLDHRAGGRVYETWDNGTNVEWGDIIVWDPPARLVMTWRGTPEPTEVELTFQKLGPSLTRVAVEHRGWEALTDEQLAEDCALPGGYAAGAYSTGWPRILACFASSVENAIRRAGAPFEPGVASLDWPKDWSATSLTGLSVTRGTRR